VGPSFFFCSIPQKVGQLRISDDSFCDLPEITEEALTRELTATNGAAAADVGPFHKQYRCILGFVTQSCYVYVPVDVANSIY
jgi:hypothetical protein